MLGSLFPFLVSCLVFWWNYLVLTENRDEFSGKYQRVFIFYFGPSPSRVPALVGPSRPGSWSRWWRPLQNTAPFPNFFYQKQNFPDQTLELFWKTGGGHLLGSRNVRHSDWSGPFIRGGHGTARRSSTQHTTAGSAAGATISIRFLNQFRATIIE